MTSVLDVRDLTALFGGATKQQLSGAANTARGVDAASAPWLARFSGYRLGLTGVSFSVDGGQCLAVLGASGSGKSSLLKTLAGLQPTGRGSILVRGNDVSALPAEQRSVVYLHQEPVLFPHLSVLENVAFPMRIRGVDARAARGRAVEWLSRLQIENVMNSSPQALSGGQRHRVALARALSADPAVLLLDEPLSSLDPAVRNDVRAALRDVRAASGAAMLLVTHDLDDAMAIASHVAAVGRSGTLGTPLTPMHLLDAPPDLDTATLLGVFSEIRGEVRDDECFHWLAGSVPAAGVRPGDAVACVRAHELYLQRNDIDGLTVTDRRESAHELTVTVRNDAGAEATVRVSSGTEICVNDRVTIKINRARFFSVG